MVVIALRPGARFGGVVAVERTERASGIGRVWVIAYISAASAAPWFDEAFCLCGPSNARLGSSREARTRLVGRGVVAGRGDASGHRAPRRRGACIRVGGDDDLRSVPSIEPPSRTPAWAFAGAARAPADVWVPWLPSRSPSLCFATNREPGYHRALAWSCGHGPAASPARTNSLGEGGARHAQRHQGLFRDEPEIEND